MTSTGTTPTPDPTTAQPVDPLSAGSGGRPWEVLDDEGRQLLRITAPQPGMWLPDKVAEIISTIEPGGCTHVTAVDADDARGLAATLLRLAGATPATRTGRLADASEPR